MKAYDIADPGTLEQYMTRLIAKGVTIALTINPGDEIIVPINTIHMADAPRFGGIK